MNQDELEKIKKEAWEKGKTGTGHTEFDFHLFGSGFNKGVEALQKELVKTNKEFSIIMKTFCEKNDAKIEALQKELDEAVEVIKFYADRNNWEQDDMDIQDYTILPSDVEKFKEMNPNTFNYSSGGKRAMEFLAKVKRG